MATKWTPGEWRVSRFANGPVVVCGQRIGTIEIASDKDLCWIAQVQIHHNCIGTPDGGSANAQLMAAAPDLYDALNRLVADLPLRRDWLDPDLERYAKAVLAKARGESA